jgi:hypothetical protein
MLTSATKFALSTHFQPHFAPIDQTRRTNTNSHQKQTQHPQFSQKLVKILNLRVTDRDEIRTRGIVGNADFPAKCSNVSLFRSYHFPQ